MNINDMIALLRDEFGQEVASVQDTLLQWQADPMQPPDAVHDMLSFLGRTSMAAQTLELTGFSSFLGVVEASCQQLLIILAPGDGPPDESVGETLLRGEIGIMWLSQWPEQAMAYLHASGQPQVVSDMADYLLMCPLSLEREQVEEIVTQLMATPTLLSGDGADDELIAATDADVSLDTDDLDPALLQALLVDAPQQLQKLEEAITHWGEGRCAQPEIIEAQRVAHTIKGSGNIIGLPGVGRLAHRLEDVLEFAVDAVRLDQPVPPPLARDMLQATLCLQQMVAYLQGQEQAPKNAKAILQRLLDWVGWIRNQKADQVNPEPVAEDVQSWLIGADAPMAQAQPDRFVTGTKSVDSGALRVGVLQLNRLLRRAGQSIVYVERMAQLLEDSTQWLAQMEHNNALLQSRLNELELLVNTQVVQLQQTQQEGEAFDPLEFDRYDALHGMSRFIAEAARDNTGLLQQARTSTEAVHTILRKENQSQLDQHRDLLSFRLVPVKTIVPRLKRTVAQTAAAIGKQVMLQVVGEEVMTDADVLSKLTEPLLHLLRNAIDHGIETPQDRLFVGKPEQGLVRLEFQRVGDEVVLQVQDDGRGLDWMAIETKAIAYGLIQQRESMTEEQLQQLILQPGFSTRDAVTETSGRGVGLDVVNDRIASLKGRLDIRSNYGEGCCFTLHIPVSSGVAHALIVQTLDEQVALPLDQVTTIVAAGHGQYQIEPDASVTWIFDGQSYPAFVLAQWLNLAEYSALDVLENAQNWVPVLVKGSRGAIALLVDGVIDSRELILQDIGAFMRRIKGVAGAALRADGHPLFLLSISDMEHAAQAAPRDAMNHLLKQRMQVQLPRVLVVDDAWSVRRSMQQLLEDAGYEVDTAADGFEALERLRAKLPAIVLSDLEMPNLNGLELTRRLREVPQWSELPVVMITSRTSNKHRAIAMDAGVNLYLTKPYQDEDLLAHVRSFVSPKATDFAYATG